MTSAKRTIFQVGVLLWFCLAGSLFAQHPIVECSRIVGTFRPLHGVNGGPLCLGETVDLTQFWKEAAIPSARLHDCEWPAPVVVDIHSIFPDFRNDPRLPENYRFGPTDDYLAPMLSHGMEIVYRLGESIEHSQTKHFVNPPPDPQKWAEICLHLVKHYNEGWADGYRYGIHYWEIWNEPENRPQMWTGTDEQYLELYTVTAHKLKRAWPQLKIGGPAVGGGFVRNDNGWTLSPFVVKFLDEIQQHDVPLDFFSWHAYTNQSQEFLDKATLLREELNRRGLTRTEIHLNEWNYLPDNDWTPMLLREDGKKREQWFHRLGGSEGAAFTASVLIALQDSPVDVANYFNGGVNPFGLFTEHGTPKKSYFAFKAFRQLLDTPQRLAISESHPNEYSIAAGINHDRNTISVLMAHWKGSESPLTLMVNGVPWTGKTLCEIHLLDEYRDFEKIRSEEISVENLAIHIHELHSEPPFVLWIKLTRLQ